MITPDELAHEMKVMPSKLVIVSTDTYSDSCVVDGAIDMRMDDIMLTTYWWFKSQHLFKMVTIRDIDGISLKLVKKA